MKNYYSGFVLLLINFSLFCQTSITINDILQKGDKYPSEIRIRGFVIDIRKYNEKCEYTLQDPVGDKILVVSRHGCPLIDNFLEVTGMVETNKTQDKIIIRESDRILYFSSSEENPLDTLEEIKTLDTGSQDLVAEMVEEEKEPSLTIVEVMPLFNNGGPENFISWIAENLKYPEESSENGIGGKVFIQFIINKLGKVQDVIVLRGVDPLLDAEAVRIIQNSPLWTPGKQGGEAVNVQFVVPITFTLQQESTE